VTKRIAKRESLERELPPFRPLNSTQGNGNTKILDVDRGREREDIKIFLFLGRNCGRGDSKYAQIVKVNWKIPRPLERFPRLLDQAERDPPPEPRGKEVTKPRIGGTLKRRWARGERDYRENGNLGCGSSEGIEWVHSTRCTGNRGSEGTSH